MRNRHIYKKICIGCTVQYMYLFVAIPCQPTTPASPAISSVPGTANWACNMDFQWIVGQTAYKQHQSIRWNTTYHCRVAEYNGAKVTTSFMWPAVFWSDTMSFQVRHDGFSIATIAVLQGVHKHDNRRCGLKEQGNRLGGFHEFRTGMIQKGWTTKYRIPPHPSNWFKIQLQLPRLWALGCLLGHPCVVVKVICPLLLALVTKLDTS